MAANPVYLDQDRMILNRVTIAATPPRPDLANEWEWNDVTGQVILQNSHPPWVRHIPSYFRESNVGRTPNGIQFIAGMTTNVDTFAIRIVGAGSQSRRRSLFAAILKSDLKKIFITQVPGGYSITKNNDALIPFDNAYPLDTLRSSRIDLAEKPVPEMIDEINLNAARGVNGPGSHWCREPHCDVTRGCMTAKPLIRYGRQPHQVIHSDTRLTCNSWNIVYLIYCKACKNQGLWTTYVGETDSERNFHQRLATHVSILNNWNTSQAYRLDDVQRMAPRIVAGLDPDNDLIMQDTHCHWNYVHTRVDRRIVILGANFSSALARKRNETIWQMAIGNYEYFPATFSGSLNVSS